MSEFYKIDRSKVQAIGITIKRQDDVQLIIPEKDMPPDCFVLFVDKNYWLEIRERIYA